MIYKSILNIIILVLQMTDQDVKKISMPNAPNGADPLPEQYYKKPYNTYRRAKFIIFSSVLKHHTKFLALKPTERFTLIEKIERSCFNSSITKANEENTPTKWDNEIFRDIYNILCAKIAANISQENNVKNPNLANKIIDGLIQFNDLPKMTSQELYPEKYEIVLKKIESSKAVKKSVKTTVMYKCRRCRRNECTYENLYNRSLDEGVNLKITCVPCGYQWNA